MRVACIATSQYEDAELDEPVAALRRAGHEIDIIAPKISEIAGKKGRSRLTPDAAIADVSATDYDALFIPGGFSPDKLRADERFLDFVRAFDEANKPIWSICHGAQLLLTAGVLDGRTVTAWRTVQDDLRRAGVDVQDQEVVIDGNLVTSREPGDLPAFCDAIVEHAEQRPGTPLARPAPRAGVPLH